MQTPLSFGSWVRQRRKALGLIQPELARLVGCSGETIRKVEAEKRRPSAQIAELLAHHLEIPPPERPAFLRAGRVAATFPTSITTTVVLGSVLKVECDDFEVPAFYLTVVTL